MRRRGDEESENKRVRRHALFIYSRFFISFTDILILPSSMMLTCSVCLQVAVHATNGHAGDSKATLVVPFQPACLLGAIFWQAFAVAIFIGHENGDNRDQTRDGWYNSC